MFDNLIQEHGSRLYALCLKLCYGKEADAQDLYPETWLKSYRFQNKYDRSRSFAAWIVKICVNTYRDQLRKQKLLKFVSQSDGDEHVKFLENQPAKGGGAGI